MSSQQISNQARTAQEEARRPDGRFGFQTAAESGVDLDHPAASDWSLNGSLDDRKVLDLCRKHAKVFGNRFNVEDRDDLEGLGAEHFVRYVRNRREKVISGEAEPNADFKVENHIRSIFRGLGQRISSGLPNGGRDITALTKHLKAREVFEMKYGREMTRTEQDELAEKIRASFPPGKRPIANFHRMPSSRQILSLDAEREAGHYVEPSTADQPQAPEPSASDAKAHDALDIVEAGGRGARLRATKSIWAVVSSEFGAPQVELNSLTAGAARSLKKEMKELGGIETVLDRYDRGQETDEDMAALLAPFGGQEKVDASGAELVVQTLQRHPGAEEGVWEAAVLTATVEKARSSK